MVDFQTERLLNLACASLADHLKSLISEPFDFHHLTHTNPAQFQSLDTARENDLVTEFSAIRASQRPVTELKGIRADDIQFRDLTPDDLNASGPSTPGEEPVSIAISTPDASPSASFSISPKQPDYKARRESRVFENFSRPVPRYSRVGDTTPPSNGSPKRTASPDLTEPTPRAIDEILGLSSQQTYPEHIYSTADDEENITSLSQLNLAGMFNHDDRPFSPVHDNGVDARTSSLSLTNRSLDLEDVPEEEEPVKATHWHDSPEPDADLTSRAPSRFGEPLAEELSPRSHPKSPLSIFVSQDLSRKFSEVLGSPTLPQHLQQQQEPAKVQSGELQRKQARSSKRAAYEAIYESWDADIDYCYEHAAEANSNFDWSRKSLDEPRRPENDIQIVTSDEKLQDGNKSQLGDPIHLSSSTLPTPELDPSPARSLPNSQMIPTPSTTGYEGEFIAHGEGDYFHPVSSSMFPSTLGKQIMQETLYEDYLAADAESDRHFSFCSHGAVQPIDHPVSPRSSFSPISKYNSQESLILSRAASIVRKHRSSVSTTSVPDLVHSSSGSREYIPGDPQSASEQLTSAVASGSATSRPGSATHRQTKSLAREIEAQVMRKDSTASIEPGASAASSPIHDRAKSTSEVETPFSAQTIKTDGVHSTGARKSMHRKKGRTSYSLFPSPVH